MKKDNESPYAAIGGTSGDDRLVNDYRGDNSTIAALGRKIYNEELSVTVTGGAGADKISNSSYGSLIAINGGEGDDYIFNKAASVSIDGGADNDTVSNSGSQVTIEGGAGEDSIVNTSLTANVTINGGDGSDTIFNGGLSACIRGGEGNDSIYNKEGTYSNIDSGNGNDSIYSYNADHVTIDGGAGDDSIKVSIGASSSINGGAGNDTISSHIARATIYGGAGNDSIYSSGPRATISGGSGNDTISNDANGALIQYTKGDGNDIIYGFDTKNTLSISGGNYSTAMSSADVIVTVGNETVRLKHVAAKYDTININKEKIALGKVIKLSDEGETLEVSRNSISIRGGAGNDSIHSTARYISIDSGTGDDTILVAGYSTVNAGSGNDNIYNGGYQTVIDMGDGDDFINNVGYYSTIKGGAGNDSILNNNNHMTIEGGAGNDYISNDYGGENVTISGGAGNDYIENSGYLATIEGGKGDDTITNAQSNVLFKYTEGDGNDIIEGFSHSSFSTLQIGDGSSTYDMNQSNDNVLVAVGDEVITLKGVKLSSVRESNIFGKRVKGNNINNTSNRKIDGTRANDTITNRVSKAVINGNAGNDSILNTANRTTIDGGTCSDTISNVGYDVSINGGAGNDSINNDGNNVTVSGGAGADTIYNNKSSVSIDGGAGEDSIYNTNFFVTIDGGDGNDSIENIGDNVTIRSSAGNNYIKNSGENVIIEYSDGDIIEGSSFNESSSLSIGGNTEYFFERHNNDIVITVGKEHVTLINTKDVADINIIGEKGFAVNLNNDKNDVAMVGSRYDDTLINTGELVTINAREGKDSVDNNGVSASIVTGDGNDTINNRGKKSTIDAGYGNDSITNNADFVSINSAADENQSYSYYSSNTVDAGDKQIFNHGSNVTITGGANSRNTINNYVGSDKVFISGDGISSVYNAGNNATISGASTITNYYSTGSSVVGNSGNNLIEIQGGHNNTIASGAGTDTIKLDTVNTNALIQYKKGEGYKLITGFNATSTLAIADVEYSSVVSGNDVIFTVGDGKITLAGAASLTSINVDGREKDYPKNINNTLNAVKISTGNLNDTIENSGFNVTINAFAGNDTIKNSAQNVTIDAGNGNDTILNENQNLVSIEGGDGNDLLDIQAGYQDTIAGGGGNDTIKLTRGVNQLIKYTTGDGNDIINGFDETSSLQIGDGTGTYSKETSGDDIILSVGAGKITLKGAATLSSVNIIGEQREPALYKENSTDNVTIIGGSSDDTVINRDNYVNRGANVTISLRGGNDSVENRGGDNAKIYTGDDSDTITNWDLAHSVMIDAGDGNDSIRNATSSNVTIIGGKGDDTINVSDNWSELIRYTVGDGNDYIKGFDENSSLSIAGNTYTTQKSGNDVIVTVYKQKITLEGAATLSKLNIIGEEETRGQVINNTGSKTLTGTDFNDTITNKGNSGTSGNSVLILAKGGNDSIENSGWYATIEGGTGNETITNYGREASIAGGAGFDSIYNEGVSSTIDGGSGDDNIYNGYSESSSINGGAGDDSIKNVGKNVTISGGAGNDSIENLVESATLDGGAGNDYIYNSGNSVTIDGGAGDDTVTQRYRNNVLMDLGAGNDYIFNAYGSENITINGGAGNDTIDNDGSKLSISGGDGDDSISLYSGDNITVTGGTGSDSIYNRAASNVLFKYKAGDGNDFIRGFNATSSISIGGGKYSKAKVGDDLILTVGDGRITLQNAATLKTVHIIGTEAEYPLNIVNDKDDASIVGTRLNDTIKNDGGANVTIQALGGDDSIINDGGDNATIDAGAGNDIIGNQGGDSVTIDAGDGADTVENKSGYNAVIMTGAGDDSINNTGNNGTIDAGAGNDTLANYFGLNMTINTGAGDDLVSLSTTSRNTVNAGAGNDTLQLVDNNKKLLIEYTAGDGNDLIEGFDDDDTLSIAGGKYTSEESGDDIIITVGKGKITLAGAAEELDLDEINIIGEEGETALNTVNDDDDVTITGTEFEDTITNNGNNVMIVALGSGDTIQNNGASVTVDGGAGNDTLNRADMFLYNAGDGEDVITDYRAGDTVSIDSALTFTKIRSGGDMFLNMSDGGTVKLVNAANKTVTTQGKEIDAYVNFQVTGSGVTYKSNVPDSIVSASYNYKSSVLTLFDTLNDYSVGVQNNSTSTLKLTDAYNFGTSTLSKGSTIGYLLDNGKVLATLSSSQFNDEIALGENAAFNFGGLAVEMSAAGKITTTGAKNISFSNSSAALVTAPGGSEIAIGAGKFVVNNLPIISANGEGTVNVADDGLSFTGYGAQVIDLEVAKENYYGKLAPMVVAYNTAEKNYTLQNTACVKTLSYDPVQLTFDFSDATKNYTVNGEKYAYYKVNDKEFLVANDKKNINVISANAAGFKIQSKDLDAANISRITIDDALTFKGTAIDFDGVKTTYTQGKPVSYSLDGKEISLSGAATVTTSADSKTYTCAAGTYTVNGKTFTTTADMIFTADSSKIQLPLNSTGEISFDGVTASGSRDGEIVFDLTNDKVSIPDGATLKVTAADALKLNLAAGNFTINSNEISSVTELEVTADKDNLKVPLGNLPVTINGANITGSDAALIDNAKTIVLPDGAFVSNVTENLFKLTAKNSAASFGDPDKKVLLTDDGAAYIKFGAEDTVSVGLSSVIFESVKISGGNSWTVETSGASGIDKITGITDGATLSASITEGAASGLQFDVETDGAGEFTLCDKEFTTTGDAKNIFTVAKNSDAIKVSAVQKSDGTLTANFGDALTVNGNEIQTAATSQATITCAGGKISAINLASDWLTADFTDGIKINGTTDADLIKIAGKQKISVADEKISIEELASGSTVESFGKAEKIITTGEGYFTVGDYVYQVTDDSDGITLVKSGDDWTVENLDGDGYVTRLFDDTYYAWDKENKIWYETAEDDGSCVITIGADNKLSLTVGGKAIKNYSSRIIQSPTSGNALTDGKIVFNENVASREISVVNNSTTATAINFGTSEILAGLPKDSEVKITADEIRLLSGSTDGMTFNLDATRKNLALAANYQIINDAENLKVTCAADSTTLNNSATIDAPADETFKLAKGTYTVNGKTFTASKNNSTVNALADGVKLNLSNSTFSSDGMTFSGSGTAKLRDAFIEISGIAVRNAANKLFKASGAVSINAKGFSIGNATAAIQAISYNQFAVGGKTFSVDLNCRVTITGGVVSEISSIMGSSAHYRTVTVTFDNKTFKLNNAAYLPTFKFNSDGSLNSIEDLDGRIDFDAPQNISVNGKTFRTTSSKYTVQSNGSAITKLNINSAGSVTTDFSAGINFNNGTIKISGATSTVSVDADGKISIENLAPDSVVESFGKAEKIITSGAGNFTIGGYVYQVTDDDDGIALVLSGDDWTVENLDDAGSVTRIFDNTSYTWDKENKIWYETAEDNGACAITIGADNKLSLAVGGQAIKNYSARIIQSPTSGNVSDGKIVLNENVASREISVVNNSATATAINFGTSEILSGLAQNAEVKITADEIRLLSDSSSGMTFNLDATRKNLALADDFQIVNAADALQVTCATDSITLSDSATITAPDDKVINFEKAATYTVNGVEFTAPANSSAKAVEDGVQFNLTVGNVFTYNNMNFTTNSASSATISQTTINLADAAQVTGSYLNQKFAAQGNVKIGSKTFNVAEDSSAIEIAFTDANNFNVADKAVALDKDAVIKIDGGKVTEITDAPADLNISGEGIAAIEIKTADAGKFTISDNEFTTADDDNVTFTTDNSGAVASIGGLSGAVTGNFSRDDGFSIDDKAITTDDDNLKVTAADDKLTAIAELDNEKFVTADFSEGIEINSTALKVNNGDKVIKVALDSDGKLSIESLAGGAVVEDYGDAQKIITVKNSNEYSLQIGDYTYAVKDDKDDDGIQLVRNGDDWSVENLADGGKVTRLIDGTSYTWDNQNKIWYETAEDDSGPCTITIGANNKLSLTVGGKAVKNYSTQIIQSPTSGNAITDGKIVFNENAASREISIFNKSKLSTAINIGTSEILSGLDNGSSVKITADEINLLSGSSTGMTFNLDATRKNLSLNTGFRITNDADNLKVTCAADSTTLSNSATVFKHINNVFLFNKSEVFKLAKGTYDINGKKFRAYSNSTVTAFADGVELDLNSGTFSSDGVSFSGTGTAKLLNYETQLTNGAIVNTTVANKIFKVTGTTTINGKTFILGNETAAIQYVYGNVFSIGGKILNVDSDCVITIAGGSVSEISGIRSGTIIFGNNTFKVTARSMPIFKFNGDGSLNSIEELAGSVEFDNARNISINGKTFSTTLRKLTVEGNGTNITAFNLDRAGSVTADFSAGINFNSGGAIQISGATSTVSVDRKGNISIENVTDGTAILKYGGASQVVVVSSGDAETATVDVTFGEDIYEFKWDTTKSKTAVAKIVDGELVGDYVKKKGVEEIVVENNYTVTLAATNSLRVKYTEDTYKDGELISATTKETAEYDSLGLINAPKQGSTVDAAGIDFAESVLSGAVTFVNSASITPQISFAGKAAVIDFTGGASVQFANQTMTLTDGEATGTTFKLGGDFNKLSLAEDYLVSGAADVKVVSSDELSLSDSATVTAPADKVLNFNKAATYTVNGVEFTAPANSSAKAVEDGVQLNLTAGNVFTYNGMNFTTGDASSATIYGSSQTINLADAAQVTGSYLNQKFAAQGTVQIGGKTFNVAEDSSAIEISFTDANNFTVADKAVALDKDAVIKIDGGKVTEISDAPADLTVSGEGIAVIELKTADAGKFTISDADFTTADDDNVTFTTDNSGAVASIGGLSGAVTGNFARDDGFSIDDKAITTDDDNLKVTAADDKLTAIAELDNGKFLTADFSEGIEINSTALKVSNNDKVIKVARDADGKLSLESLAGGANVENYSDAQKIITVGNRREYSLQIGDYTYNVKDDIDDDGITFELVDGDFKVRTLSDSGKVTRYDANNKVQLWLAADDKWIDEQEYKGYYEITINTDKTLTLKAGGSEVAPYSDKIIKTPKSGEPVDKNITVTGNAPYKTTTFTNNSDAAPNILVASIIPFFADEQIITALAANAAVKVDNNSFSLQSETATGTTFKLDANRKTLNLADNFKVTYVANSDRTTNVKLTSDNNDLTLSNRASVTAPEGKAIEFTAGGDYSVNGINFNVTSGTKAETVERGIKFDLSTGKVQYDGLTLEGTGTAQITNYNPDVIALTDGAIVTAGDDPFSYYNRNFLIEGDVKIVGKQFRSDKQVNAGLVYFQTSTATLNPDGTYESVTTTTTGFVVENKYVNIQSDCYDFVKVVDGKIATIEGVKAPADISGDGIQNVSILTDGVGLFTINGATYNVNNNSVGVIFQTDSSGNVSNIKWQRGAVTANFENAITINDRAVQVAGASQIKVAGDENGVTEISQVEGDLSGNRRKDIQVYNAGGASSFSTSDASTIIFNGKTFKTDAAKLFALDASGNVSAISALSGRTLSRLLSNNEAADSVAENLATMTLDTTDGLEEISGDFSEGITVNGVFVKVTDSTDFVVKEDDENIYIETTGAGDFTINGKTFETEADKTIFKLDDAGNVSEIVTDTFFPDAEAYLIEGDFRDEIIFNGKKFCVTGVDKAGIFMEGDETLLSLKLTNSIVNVEAGGDNSEIIASGNGTLILGDNTYQTTDDFRGFFNVAGGSVESMRYFIGTLSGKLGGVKLVDLTITTDDEFSATGDDNKVTALENLQNATFTCGELQSVKINGAEISVTNSEEFTATIIDGALAIDGLKDSAIVESSGAAVTYTVEESGEFLIGENEFKLTGDSSLTFTTDENGIVQEISGLDENARLTTSTGGTYLVNGKELTAQSGSTFIGLANNSAKLLGAGEELLENVGENTFTFDENTAGNQNISLGGGDVAIVEEGTTAKVSITASAGEDTIYSAGDNVFVSLRGGATDFIAAGGKASLENYDAATGAVLVTSYDDIFAAIKGGDIRFGRDKVSIGAAVVNVEGDFLNFSDAAQNIQQVGFAYVDESLNASSEKSDLILVGDSNSTLLGGKGDDSIYAGEDAHIDAGAGKNLVELSGDGGAIIELSGNTTVTGFTDGDALQTSTDNLKLNFDGENLVAKNNSAKVTFADVAENKISIVDGGETLKAYVAQDGENISVNETADLYYGKKSGVDFSAYDENLMLNLAGGSFIGINRVTLGGGLNTVISSAQNETLTSNSNGTTQFIFDAGAGHDLIQNFNFAEDKISVGAAVTNVVLRNSGDVIIQLGDEWITLEDAQGKQFKINDFTALVDKNISYDEAANYFLATSKNASVIVDEEAEVWLDGSHGKNFVGNIKTLDASTSDGNNTLAGNDLDNVICAGKGDASLWGGNGNDLLVGGKAHNLFFYTSGNDTIQSANDSDAVILSNVTLDQISGTSITSSGVAINFKSGGSLTVDSRADITYQLADGSQFSANHDQLTWQAK